MVEGGTNGFCRTLEFWILFDEAFAKMMNWRQIYGDDEFQVKAPVYWSDILRRQQRRQVDLEELKQRAMEYAKVRFFVLFLFELF